MDENESLRVQVTRIDCNVTTLLEYIPMVKKNDKDMFTMKIIVMTSIVIMALIHPKFAELVGNFLR